MLQVGATGIEAEEDKEQVKHVNGFQNIWDIIR
jgi:hypothetical protein